MEARVCPIIDKDAGARLAVVRMKMLMNQAEAADLLGLSQPTYSKLERGFMEVAPFTLAKLRAVFGTNAHFIILGSNNPESWPFQSAHKEFWKAKLTLRRKPGSGRGCVMDPACPPSQWCQKVWCPQYQRRLREREKHGPPACIRKPFCPKTSNCLDHRCPNWSAQFKPKGEG